MKLKKQYLKKYPKDDLGLEISTKADFVGLLDALNNNKDIYEYIGVYDSIIRERLFFRLAELINEPYEYIYKLWLKKL